MATTSPAPLVTAFGERLGMDAVIATEWATRDGEYTGELDGPIVWGRGKLEAVRAWADAEQVDLRSSYAYSDSYYDAPLLDAVGNPVAVNPDLRLAGLARLRGLADPPPRPARGRAEDRRARAAGLDALPAAPGAAGQRAPRHRRCRADPPRGPGHRRVQPPQLLRRHRGRRRARPDRALVPLPRQEGGVRRAGHRRVRPHGRRHPGQPVVGLRRTAGGGDQGPATPARRSPSPPRARSRAGRRSSPPSCAAGGAPPGSPRRPARRSSRSACGAPRRCGRATPACRACRPRSCPRSGSASANRSSCATAARTPTRSGSCRR